MENSPKPLLSILIPTWNRTRQVLDAVESIGTIGADMEVVIVDNASSPSLFLELQQILAAKVGVRLFRNENNLGMVKNWNRCLELSQGEWVGLLCSDDRYQSGAIERLRELIAKYPEPSLIVQEPAIEQQTVLCPPGGETVRDLRLPIASGNFWHRRVYEQIGGFDERFEYSADAEYWYRAALSFPVVKVREPFAEYVPHENNYMWATWRRPDYLQQTELLARTVAGYIFHVAADKGAMVERYVSRAVWQTLLSIIACTFLDLGKRDILRRYLPEAVIRIRSFSNLLQLLSALGGALIHRCSK